MDIRLPEELIKWLDSQRGEYSRQVFIIKCLFKLKEVSDFGNVKSK